MPLNSAPGRLGYSPGRLPVRQHSVENVVGGDGRIEGERYSPLTCSNSTGQRPRRLSALFADCRIVVEPPVRIPLPPERCSFEPKVLRRSADAISSGAMPPSPD